MKIGPWLGRPAFHKVLFPPTAKANAASWPGLKASRPLPTSAGQPQGGPESTVHGQVCYSIPSTSDIRFPSVNLNNQIELKSALASRKMSKIPHGPQLLRVGNSAQPLPLFSSASCVQAPGQLLEFLCLNCFPMLPQGKGKKNTRMNCQYPLFLLVHRPS